MCRFVVYQGPAIAMASVLLGTENSLIKQSKHARKRRKTVNGDGFGIGWYLPDAYLDPEPGILVGVEPAWASRNLQHMTRKIQSAHFFAHIRDATAGMSIGENNCHPFYQGRLLWMHNGKINGFQGIKREFIALLSDEAFDGIQGNTDSEYLFALFQTVLAQAPDQSLANMALALERTIQLVVPLVQDVDGASFLNIAVSNGNGFIVTRYVTDIDIQPASLFYAKGNLKLKVDDDFRLSSKTGVVESLVVASEPLTRFRKDWIKVERNHMLLVDHNNMIEIHEINS